MVDSGLAGGSRACLGARSLSCRLHYPSACPPPWCLFQAASPFHLLLPQSRALAAPLHLHQLPGSTLAAGTEESTANAVAAANVQQLCEMGFSAQQARQALEECGQDLETALVWLTENCI